MRRAVRSSRAPCLLLVVLVFAGFGGPGCASYSTSIREAQVDLRAGRPQSALEVVNDRLEVDSAEAIPEDLKKNRVLLLLERATLLQALNRYALSARDMVAVNQRMEWLDIDGEKSADLAKYLYSASATPYRAPPYERMLLNTLNMVNFLAMGDNQGAKVEARRFRLLEEFFAEDDAALLSELLAVGNYLSGVAFEGARDYDIAIRHYGKAWSYGYRPPELRERIVALTRVTGWKGAGVATTENGLEDIIIEAELRGALLASEYRRQFVDGSVLVVVQSGLAPYKVPERLPIGAALVYLTYYDGRHGLSAAQVAHVRRLQAEGLVKWVNFPVLVESTRQRSVDVFVEGSAVPKHRITNVSEQVRAAWKRIAGALMGAAILRMVARAVAGGATRAGSRVAAKAKDAPAIGALGWLAGVALEGALAAADVPDTRSWTTLPAAIHLARVNVEPGNRRVAVKVGGRVDERTFEVTQGTTTVLNFSRVR